MLLYIAVHLQYSSGGAMAATKSTTLTLRIDPNVKEALRAAAEQEHRSITNMVEVLIRDYCQQHNIALGQQNMQSKSSNR